MLRAPLDSVVVPRPAGTATTLPGATPMTRGAGESDDSKRRGYLIAPPPLFPLVPAFARQTYRYEVDPGRMWFFEQKQGIGLGLNVSVNVRMTVIKLKTGGLWVHAPVAPTQECIALLAELDVRGCRHFTGGGADLLGVSRNGSSLRSAAARW